MKCGLILLPVLALGADVVESPVQKVVTMLKAMSEKGKAELQEEKVQYARYAQWCSSTQAEKSSAIEDAAGKLEVLSADMAKATTEAEVLSKEIEEHNSQIVRIGEEQEKAKEVRAKEAEDYTKELKDYTEAVDAISRALDTMETQALLQLGSGRAAQEVKRLVSMAKPKVASYESQTGIITAMLKNMQKQFVEEKHSLETNETSKVHSFELLMTSLQNQQGSESEDKERKAGLKAKKLSLKASKEDELSTTKSSKEADTKYLDDVSATCRQKAIEQAVRIVSQKLSLLEVKWRGLLQVKRHGRRKATSLALLRSVKNDERIQAKLLGFLQGEAQRLRSAALTNLLQPVATEALGKVRETIEGEIERLEEQDTQDTEKQTWCSSELKSNEKTRRSKRVKVDELTADIDRLNAWVISLGEDIQNLQDELTDSAKAMANASEIRQGEKLANAGTIAEAQKAQAAVVEAISVLKEFYEKSGLGAALLQEGSKEPDFDTAYGGQDAGGVVQLLQQISADFARLEADTKAEEQSATEEFEKLSKDYKLNKAEKETDLKHLQQSKVEKTSQLATKGGELQSGQQELAAALQYYEELKPPCVKGGKAWQEREKQREEELKSLKEAVEIMSNATK